MSETKENSSFIRNLAFSALTAVGIGAAKSPEAAHAINNPGDNVDLEQVMESRTSSVRLGGKEYQVVTPSDLSRPVELSGNQIVLAKLLPNGANRISATGQDGEKINASLEADCIVVNGEKKGNYDYDVTVKDGLVIAISKDKLFDPMGNAFSLGQGDVSAENTSLSVEVAGPEDPAPDSMVEMVDLHSKE